MNTGAANARNIGAHFAKGSIVVFLDADMEFPPNFIANLVKPILSGSSKSSCPGDEIIANVESPWVRVQGQRIRGFGSVEKTVFVRAVERDLFLRSGGFDARFGYFDDATFYMRTGITSVVVKDAFLYHYNPDTAREILWRNFWIGRSVLRIHNSRDVAVIALKRAFDLSPPCCYSFALDRQYFVYNFRSRLVVSLCCNGCAS
jgi:glycosyltransferase involved in cell wall biosynthesis